MLTEILERVKGARGFLIRKGTNNLSYKHGNFIDSGFYNDFVCDKESSDDDFPGAIHVVEKSALDEAIKTIETMAKVIEMQGKFILNLRIDAVDEEFNSLIEMIDESIKSVDELLKVIK